jgi:hypothetical protein
VWRPTNPGFGRPYSYGQSENARPGASAPSTAISLNELALLNPAQGDPPPPTPSSSAPSPSTRVLGPDHADIVATRRALDELAEEGGGAW